MAQEYNKEVGSNIGYDQGKKWIDNFKSKLAPGATQSYFLGSNIIQSIIDQKDCVGIRICYATKDDGSQEIILVGLKKDGTMIWANGKETGTEDGIVADNSWRCPPLCSPEE